MPNGMLYTLIAIYTILFSAIVIGLYELILFILRHLQIGWA